MRDTSRAMDMKLLQVWVSAIAEPLLWMRHGVFCDANVVSQELQTSPLAMSIEHRIPNPTRLAMPFVTSVLRSTSNIPNPTYYTESSLSVTVHRLFGP
jgi:hypothetical protein